MNNIDEIDIYNRSINLYKITDGEYKDKYVSIYIYLSNLCNDFEMYEIDKYPGVIFFGKSETDIYGQLNPLYDTCFISSEKFQHLIKMNPICKEVIQNFISNFFDSIYRYILFKKNGINYYMNPNTKNFNKISEQKVYKYGDWVLHGFIL